MRAADATHTKSFAECPRPASSSDARLRLLERRIRHLRVLRSARLSRPAEAGS